MMKMRKMRKKRKKKVAREDIMSEVSSPSNCSGLPHRSTYHPLRAHRLLPVRYQRVKMTSLSVRMARAGG